MPRQPARPLHRITRAAHARWWATPRAQRLVGLSRMALAERLPDVFGRELLQIGCWGGHVMVDAAATLHRAVLGAPLSAGAQAWMEPEALPLPADSIDGVLLPHTLEFCGSPHQVLREVDRVLNDRGQLFILGFNPWGSSAWRSRLRWPRQRPPDGIRLTRVGQLEDWLALLDFEVTEVHRFSAGFPWLLPSSDGATVWWRWLLQPFQEVYLLSARKRKLPMNLLPRPQRAQPRSLIGAPVARRDANFSRGDDSAA